MQEKDITVVIASSEDESVFQCIDSVRDEANIVVSMTPSASIEARLTQQGIPHVIVPRGNLGHTFNAGIELAPTDKVIIMTDDATFNPGTIQKLSDGLDEYDACKAKIMFEHNDHPFSKVVAQARSSANDSPRRVFTPGLAIHKDSKDKLGGHFFDEDVKWAEDAEFSYRFRRSGLRFGYIEDASINHPPVAVKHDLRGAFLIGLSKRRAVDLGLREGDENVIPTLKRIMSGETFARKQKVLHERGLATAAYMTLWDSFYNAGYNLRRLGLSDGIEARVWQNFGRDRRNISN